MAGFLTKLELEYDNGRRFTVTAPFEYCIGAPNSHEIVYIHPGFLTDFASIPRLLWNILPPTGSYGKAAVIHDYLYQFRRVFVSIPSEHDGYVRLCSRAEADAVLLEAMKVLGVSRLTRWVIYLGVRLGGWVAWRQHRAEDELT